VGTFCTWCDPDGWDDDQKSRHLLVGFRDENVWGVGSFHVFNLCATGEVEIVTAFDDDSNVEGFESVSDRPAFALDAIRWEEELVILGANIFGPLFDGDTALGVPLLPTKSSMAWETQSQQMLESPSNRMGAGTWQWGTCCDYDKRVADLFRARVSDGTYPAISRLLDVGSPAWVDWAIGLIVMEPLGDPVPWDTADPAISEEALRSLPANDLLATAKHYLRLRARES
jgi:hypothetical protein